MTPLQQSAIDHLFTGGYLALRDRRKTAKGEDFIRYTLYKGNAVAVRIYHERTLQRILQICKRDKHGRYTLNLNLVRQLRKNSYVKALYLEIKKTEGAAEIMNQKMIDDLPKYNKSDRKASSSKTQPTLPGQSYSLF
jgi:hypothetical protein